VSTAIKERIKLLLEESTQFNANDVLVNIDRNAVVAIDDSGLKGNDLPYSTFKTILKKAHENERESGVNPLCLAQGILEWEIKNEVVSTPIILTPCIAVLNKIDQTVRFEIDQELAFINPFLLLRLKRDFDVHIPAELQTSADLSAFLEEKKFGKCHSDKLFVGNFHHHRFEQIKELEELVEITPSANVAQLLGDESKHQPAVLELTRQILFPSDPDQQAVFRSFLVDNTVVQGPPGTGKSQVLANLIAKLIAGSHSAVVISEKRVALEVIKKKLNEFDLGCLCFIATSETITRDVLAELKENWGTLENRSVEHRKNLMLSEQYLHKLQMQLDILNDPSQFGGVGYTRFSQLIKGNDLKKVEFRSDLPDTSTWLEANEHAEKIFKSDLQLFIGFLSPSILKNDLFFQLDRTVQQLLSELTQLNEHFSIDNWSDLHNAMKKAALCQVFSSADFRRYEAILTPDSKEQKKFIKLYKKYIQLKTGLAPFESEKQHWIYEPSLTQTESLLNDLKDRSYIGKWRFKKQWKKLARISDSYAETILLKWKQYLSHLNSISQIEVEFCDLGIIEPINSVEQLYLSLHAFSETDYASWRQIPLEERVQFAGANQALNRLYHELKTYFRFKETTHLSPFLNGFLVHFEELTQLRSELLNIQEIVLRNLAEFDSFESMNMAVLKANQVRFNGHFPAYADFQPTSLLDQVHRIVEEQQDEAKLFAQNILDEQTRRFNEFHELLRTPSTKLSSGEKELKARLKKGKAILVKEFGKTRSFPSMRELFASDARFWIQLFKPIWLSNPAQVAKCFPMEEGLFDVAIFDEASQIILQNALGSIHRAKRVLVAGDNQQMGPSTYFKTQSGEAIDILHQASFYWKNVSLKHHYRSEHPGLIAFSNHHFYKGQLQAFPSFKQEKQAIEWHFCEKGVYEERKNEKEAKMVAKHLESLLDSTEVLGIVAFSETQLETIYQALSTKGKIKLEERMEEETAFFKALENVQGEECDRLIISLGYGKNPEGEFHMRFGPINSKNGSKRLNVLFTRARRKIDFFTSVKGEDFQISSNEAVDLLRQYLQQLESESFTANCGFPYDLFPTINVDQLIFHHIHSALIRAEELVTTINVLEKRGWKVVFN
jgi:hypothetical protein